MASSSTPQLSSYRSEGISQDSRRPKMSSRKTMVIIPATGARLQDRNYTLRTSDDDENTPLINGRNARRNSQSSIRERDFRQMCSNFWKFLNSKKARMVIKCSLAYFLGSLATFVTPISRLLGHYDGKHMVATFCVYFHPARSAGSMHQATMYALIAFVYSSVVSVGSMALSIAFAEADLIELGHALVLLIFCAGGMGLIGYIKQKKSHPTVSVACSMASISITTILTKEGSVQRAEFKMGKIWQVSMIVAMSIVISNFLAFTLWPTSAITELRQVMTKCTATFSETLNGITHSFLNGSDDEIKATKYATAAENHKTVFTSLLKNLREAKYEHYVLGTEQEYHQEKLLVECLQRLSQNIGGLRSAALTQFSLLRQAQNATNPQAIEVASSPKKRQRNTNHLFTPPDHDSSRYLPSDDSSGDSSSTADGNEDAASDTTSAPISVFKEFINHLGPPMKSLAYTLNLMLDDLPYTTGEKNPHTIQVNPQFEESLKDAIELYELKRSEALATLYRSDEITQSRSLDADADVEEIAASCGYFSYNLLHFAEEMKTFLYILRKLQCLQEGQPRTWEWLKFWKGIFKKKPHADHENIIPTMETVPVKRARTIPNVSPEAKVQFSYKVWKALGVLRRDNIKFSVKVGVGAALYALPAFIPATRPTFSLWRGEWGLVSYMIIMSMTLGQTNNSGEARVLGNLVGALLALVSWILFEKDPYALSVFGWIVCIPCFWIILNWKQATFGRFVLLTYNLSALYAYSLSAKDDDDDDDEGGIDPLIAEIVLHRFVAVTVGVMWGLFVNRMVWPISARQQLRKGLSVLWLRMSLIWYRDPLDMLVEGKSDQKHKNITEEQSLQKALFGLNSVAAVAPHEFRLKGPFPTKEYQKILKANQAILDAFHGMSIMIAKDPNANRREAQILSYTKKERDDLCARISHLFYVLGSSIRIGFPLPENLPNTTRARDRLLAKIFDYRKTVKGIEGEKLDEDLEMLYAYALATARISEGLDESIHNMGLLYGVLEDEMLEF
ncbi:Fusaric acid resistance protein-like-domain-containing protein [Geopyxis carbonaria]|nr:Fusaric acid resistance protein-like-domain-containing protein [Geopyxis carbonaria]